jgi:hypothetical protein
MARIISSLGATSDYTEPCIAPWCGDDTDLWSGGRVTGTAAPTQLDP